MISQNPRLNINPRHKKGVNLHFDADAQIQTEQQPKQSLIESKQKRQNQILQQQRKQTYEKSQKKLKTDTINYFEEEQPKALTNYLSTAQNGKRNVKDQSEDKFQVSINGGKTFISKVQAEEHDFQKITIQLFRELLLHPNKQPLGFLNGQIVNRYILGINTPIRLKSFLMLYMILFRFDEIQFEFTKTIFYRQKSITKDIIIQESKNAFIKQLSKDENYQKFRKNQFQRYLVEYIEWLIWINETLFQIKQDNLQFSAMALNNCDKVASELINTKQSNKRKNNVFLAFFLLNAQDKVFRNDVKVPSTERILSFMQSQDLESLPQCHWLLGLNISAKYFIKKKVFNQRVGESLILENNTYRNREITQFYHEYQLLRLKFCSGNLPPANYAPKKIVDSILEWIAIQSNCRHSTLNVKTQLPKQTKQSIISLNKKICKALIMKAVENSQLIQQNLFLVLQILDRQSFLSEKEKVQIFSQTLYSDNFYALKFGKKFSQAIAHLQKKHETVLSNLFICLIHQYNHNYKYRLLSNQPQIKNDLLAQLKHLINIDIQFQDQAIIERLNSIISSFIIITHWNKDIILSFIKLLQKHVQKLEDYLKKNTNQQKSKTIKSECQQLQSLNTFLQIQQKLEPLNMLKLNNIIDLTSKQYPKFLIPFEQRTISYIKKSIIGILFVRFGANQSLLSEIKKQFILNSTKMNQESNNNANKKSSTLTKLQNMAKQYPIFWEKIKLLKNEALL